MRCMKFGLVMMIVIAFWGGLIFAAPDQGCGPRSIAKPGQFATFEMAAMKIANKKQRWRCQLCVDRGRKGSSKSLPSAIHLISKLLCCI